MSSSGISSTEIIAAADGSALGNPGPAGWAWYVDENCWGAGGWKHGTNNMGELKAVLELFKATEHVSERRLHILCDSKYTIDSLTKWMYGWKKKGWKKSDGKPVLNLELFKELDAALAGRDYTFEWVKGHAGHPMNEAADERARAAATAFRDGKKPLSGPGFTRETSDTLVLEEPHTSTSDVAEQTSDFDVQTVLDAEASLLHPKIHSDEEHLKKILSNDFQWISPSGRIIDRQTVVQYRDKAFFSEEEPEIIEAEQLGETVIRVLSRVKTVQVQVLRTSLWVKTPKGATLNFRQETALPR